MTRRIAIFAGYNRYPAIEDYVLYYLKELQKVVDDIIYVADNSSSEHYLAQLTPITPHIILQNHGEYDFGSWKRGLKFAQEKKLLKNTDELILCNDSCYGPVFPFTEMFEKMARDAHDFWGITQNCQQWHLHLQSYFLVFKRNVFNSHIFQNFFEGVKKQKSFWDVVSAYEVGLSQTLLKKGDFSFGCYCPIDARQYNPTFLSHKLLKERCPLLKRKIYTHCGNLRLSKTLLLWQIPNPEIRKFAQKDYFRYFGKRLSQALGRFLYQNKTTKSGKHLVKICKIPVIVVQKDYQI